MVNKRIAGIAGLQRKGEQSVDDTQKFDFYIAQLGNS